MEKKTSKLQHFYASCSICLDYETFKSIEQDFEKHLPHISINHISDVGGCCIKINKHIQASIAFLAKNKLWCVELFDNRNACVSEYPYFEFFKIQDMMEFLDAQIDK